MKSSTFDVITKALATSDSRHQALFKIGGILGGALVATFFSGFTTSGNSACAQFCHTVFGPGSSEAGKCTSDAAHNTGLCYTCGPASPGGTRAICCVQNLDGTCVNYESTTCCSSDQVCMNGICVNLVTTTTTMVPIDPTTTMVPIDPTTTTAPIDPTTTTAPIDPTITTTSDPTIPVTNADWMYY